MTNEEKIELIKPRLETVLGLKAGEDYTLDTLLAFSRRLYTEHLSHRSLKRYLGEENEL